MKRFVVIPLLVACVAVYAVALIGSVVLFVAIWWALAFGYEHTAVLFAAWITCLVVVALGFIVEDGM